MSERLPLHQQIASDSYWEAPRTSKEILIPGELRRVKRRVIDLRAIGAKLFPVPQPSV